MRRDQTGVCIATFPGDLRFAYGAVESARFFLPAAPVCVIWDGPGDLPEMRRTYDVRVLHRGNVQTEYLRAEGFGRGRTKLVGLWDAPFERYLYYDADAVVWGDLVSRMRTEVTDDWDVVMDRLATPCTDEAADTWIINKRLAAQCIPEFRWHGHLPDYTAAGAFFARTGSVGIAAYERARNMQKAHPGLFFGGDQGLTNYMIWNAVDEAGLRVKSFHFHTFALDHPIDELARRFPIGPDGPLPSDEPAGVLHWPLKKPWSVATDVYTAPMTYFREQAFARMRPSLAPWRAQIIRMSDRWALLRPRLKWSRIPAAADRRFRRLLGLPDRES